MESVRNSNKQRKLKEEKNAIVLGLMDISSASKPSIAKEWLQAKTMGIDHTITSFPATHRNKYAPLSDQDDAVEYYYNMLDMYSLIDSLLKQIGSVCFYIDKNGYVFNKSGDPKLLDHFKHIGLKFGASFSEKSIGVSVFSLSRAKPLSIIYRIGEENYLDLFSEYVCIAITFTDFENRVYTDLFVIPLETYTPSAKQTIKVIAEFKKMVHSKRFYSAEDIENKRITDSALSLGQDNVIVCNSSGKIIFVNSELSKLVLSSTPECIGEPLEAVFPELSFCTESLKTGKRIPLGEICIASKKQNASFYVECLPIKLNNTTCGIKILLKESSIMRKYAREMAVQEKAHYHFEDMKGSSAKFVETINLAKKISNSDSNVLILGESGTGKELLAHSIHNSSIRKDKPFIAINCGAIPKDLIASEFFGYEEGAFTGAKKGGDIGKLEMANGGTVFLDEIGEMPYDMQAMLLRFLEDGAFYKVGGHSLKSVNVRIIAATNRNVEDYIKSGKFRLDLFYRICVVKLIMPPLRERIDDIPLLVENMIKLHNANIDKTELRFSDKCMELLKNYSWPGNLRELRNLVEFCCSTVSNEIIELSDLPQDIIDNVSQHDTSGKQTTYQAITQQADMDEAPLEEILFKHKKNQILDLLIKHNGNKAAVAAEMGISRNTLYTWMKKYNVSTN